MSHIHKILQSLNFSPVETEIYLMLAENEKLNVSAIIEKTQKSRTAVHTALNALLAKDFILYEKVGREAFYSLAHPHKLYGLLEEKKLDDARQYEDVSSAINSLVGSYQLSHNKPGVRFFEGEDGAKKAIRDSLNATEPILTIINTEALQGSLDDINKEYVRERIAKHIEKHILVVDSEINRAYMKAQGSTLTEVRFLPKSMLPFVTTMEIYNNKISYFTLKQGNVFAFLIEDKDIYLMHKNIFLFLWNIAMIDSQNEA